MTSRGVFLFILLAGCHRRPSTEALIERLGSANQETRIRAAYALESRGAEVVPALIDAIDDERPLVPEWATSVLGQMGSLAEPAIPRLIQALDDTDHGVRRSATYTLANLRVASALPSLLLKIKDPVPDVRAASLWAVSVHPRDPGVVIPAIASAFHDPDADIRVRAASALARFAGEATVALPDLLALLDDGSPAVRAAAASAIGAIGPAAQPALDRLVKAMNDDDDQGVRKAAALAIVGLGAEALPPLIDALRHRDRFTRVGVVHAIGELESAAKGAIPALKQAIEEGDPLVIGAAEEAIQRIEGAIAADEAEAREKAEAEAEARAGR